MELAFQNCIAVVGYAGGQLDSALTGETVPNEGVLAKNINKTKTPGFCDLQLNQMEWGRLSVEGSRGEGEVYGSIVGEFSPL